MLRRWFRAFGQLNLFGWGAVWCCVDHECLATVRPVFEIHGYLGAAHE